MSDNFNSNHFSDLAPFSALFWDRIMKQYIYRSVGLINSLMFVMAPLGIISVINGVIRVSGPLWMVVLIGILLSSQAKSGLN